MYRHLILIPSLIFLLCPGCKQSDDQSGGTTGRIIQVESFPSRFIEARPIHIWLPANYDTTLDYAVIYMHDGQMLFDSTQTWNKKEWQVDETMAKLLQEDKIKPAIVIGIDNNAARRAGEYFPEEVLKEIPQEANIQLRQNFLGGEPLANEYLQFLIQELKPYIDSTYSTLPDQANTFIMGSSMGGLISLYAICEYPEIFGGAGCMSTHWPLAIPDRNATFDLPATFRRYLDIHLPSPVNHLIYFDYGTATLDSLYKPHQLKVDSIMELHGYNIDNWMTREFPGDEHDEVAWAGRLDIPIEFLLRKVRVLTVERKKRQ